MPGTSTYHDQGYWTWEMNMAAQFSWSLGDHLEVCVCPLDLDKLRARPLPESCERSIRDTSAIAPDLGPSSCGKEQRHSSDLLYGGPWTEGSTTP